MTSGVVGLDEVEATDYVWVERYAGSPELAFEPRLSLRAGQLS